MDQFNYLTGFGNHFSTEAIEGVLPQGQNSPQSLPENLYAEQLSGSAFTAPRGKNLRSWLYKKKPSVSPAKFELYTENPFLPLKLNNTQSPEQLRWNPLELK